MVLEEDGDKFERSFEKCRAMKERNIMHTTEAQLDWLHLVKELPYKTRCFRKDRRDEKRRKKT